VGSQELLFHPGRLPQGGHFQWDIGTAGSTMLALALLPVVAFAQSSLPPTCGWWKPFWEHTYTSKAISFPFRALGTRHYPSAVYHPCRASLAWGNALFFHLCWHKGCTVPCLAILEDNVVNCVPFRVKGKLYADIY